MHSRNSQMAAAKVFLSPDMSLFEVPPSTMEHFCNIMDCSDGTLGWRGLAEHFTSDWMEFCKIEKYAEQGKSRTRELLWSLAHKNKTVGDLLTVLKEMGHKRALKLFMNQDVNWQNACSVGLKALPLQKCDIQTQEENTLSSISLQMIIKGTNDFHQNFLIAEGEFFKVYKAEVHRQSCVVKVLKQDKHLAEPKQWNLFISKLMALPRFQHPNIVQLLGYLSYPEKTFLVCPYMVNRSLYERIKCTEKSSPLPWQIRYNILVGVANLIKYLHSMKPRPVICGNITSKNILLDQHFHPKLSDFAMVHLRSYMINHNYTIKMDHATCKFLGYLPEEYISRGNLSSKTDMYSYGVVMMEVLTGFETLIKGSKDTYLRYLLWEQMEKSGLESLFPLLDKKAGKWPQCVARNLFNLCLDCTILPAILRPTVEEVLERTESAKNVGTYKEDLPKSLKSLGALNYPEESDESLCPVRIIQGTVPSEIPYECSQSEVTFLGVDRNGKEWKTAGTTISSVKTSDNPSYADCRAQLPEPSYLMPIECSCSSPPDSSKSCDGCIANGFGHSISWSTQ
ncbi:interleukin-1 receptor-associated kinase 3 [Xenopus laevis]|uniref:Protein kinase domain-containing protein n=2 Tax=Xenopus laevis TaxID=8355 RepID=A0A974DDV2_XENLA|nr:interleukin-1 receptor-associated kinase 3 [Xenopus laevis]OCT88896.1 hypothetical protein XELAEV_18017526mg [Xenopus laevis]